MKAIRRMTPREYVEHVDKLIREQEKENIDNLTVTADNIIDAYLYVLNIEVDLDEVAKDWQRTKTDIKELEKELSKMAEVIDGLININIAIPKELTDIFHQKNEELKKLR